MWTLSLLVLSSFLMPDKAQSCCTSSTCDRETATINVVHGGSHVVMCEGQAPLTSCTSNGQVINDTITSPLNGMGMSRTWLVINNIDSSFTVYCCSKATCTQKTEINVFRVPSVTSISPTTLEYTHNYTIKCMASNSPEHYTLRLPNGTARNSSSGWFSISVVQFLANTSTYGCEACNWAGCSQWFNQSVTVTVPPPTIYSLNQNPSNVIESGTTSKVDLSCRARGTTAGVRFEWKVNDSSNLSTNRSYTFQSESNTVNVTQILYIDNPTAANAGNYSCITSSTSTAGVTGDARSIHVVIVDPPYVEVRISPTTTQPSSGGPCVSSGNVDTFQYCALNGTTHSFTCAYNGSEPLAARWVVHTSAYNHSNSSRMFTATLDHSTEGRYQCVANNTDYSHIGATDTANVTVYDHSSLYNSTQTSMTALTGQSFSLSCQLKLDLNDPNTPVIRTIEWAQTMPPSNINLESANGFQPEHSTTWQSTYSGVAGSVGMAEYKCSSSHASLRQGAETAFTLQIYDVPSAVEASMIMQNGQGLDYVNISWTAPVDNNADITDYRVEISSLDINIFVQNPGTRMAGIAPLRPFKSYNVSVYARNAAGEGEQVRNEKRIHTLTAANATVLEFNASMDDISLGPGPLYAIQVRWWVETRLLSISNASLSFRLTKSVSASNDDTIFVMETNQSCRMDAEVGSLGKGFCYKWDGFKPDLNYTLTIAIVYVYGDENRTGDPVKISVTIPTSPESGVGVIVGVVFGLLVVLIAIIIIILVAILCCRRMTNMKKKREEDASMMTKSDKQSPMEDLYVINDLKQKGGEESPYVIEHQDFTGSAKPHQSEPESSSEYAPLDLSTMESTIYTPYRFDDASNTGASAGGTGNVGSSDYEPLSIDAIRPSGQVVCNGTQSHEISDDVDVYMEPDCKPTVPLGQTPPKANSVQYANLPHNQPPVGNTGPTTSIPDQGTANPGLSQSAVKKAWGKRNGDERANNSSSIGKHGENEELQITSSGIQYHGPSEPLDKMSGKHFPLPLTKASPSKKTTSPSHKPGNLKKDLPPDSPLSPLSSSPRQPLILVSTTQASFKAQPLTPSTQPSLGQQPLTPSTQPSSGKQPLTPPTHPSSGKQPLTPSTQPSSGKQPLTPPTHPSLGQQPLTPSTQPSSGKQPLTPPTQPSSGKQPLTPSTQPSSGKQPLTPPTQPSSGKQPLTPPTQPSPGKQPLALASSQSKKQTHAPLTPTTSLSRSNSKSNNAAFESKLGSLQRGVKLPEINFAERNKEKEQKKREVSKVESFRGPSTSGETDAQSSSVAELRKKLQHQIR